jgi:CRISPR-associated endonuclease/helicase Cas3
LLLIAPTGLGKTFAVTGDIRDQFQKIVYAVPLRALGNDIRRGVLEYERGSQRINAVIHHGGVQESTLFGEEFIVTTYDQVICGAPGLPLSLPLKAGHAVAGALLMSRLIFDEAHLAWGISEQALSILLAIAEFRTSLGLQTILMTATLPDEVSKLLSTKLGIERVLVGEGGEVEQDESLSKRDQNRQVTFEPLDIKKGKQEKELNFVPLDKLLMQKGQGKRIYFANTVDRLQDTYDRLAQSGVDAKRISVLHNRMPHAWRGDVEEEVKTRFGKQAKNDDWILLTNQVAEAGLDISAPLVISDPAPVDTLVQRAGRCARWFRDGLAQGCFMVIKVPGLKSNPSQEAKDYVRPYRVEEVISAIESFPDTHQLLSWEVERNWINKAWGGGKDKALKKVKEALNNTTFALNLFDRAAQERRPGDIASVFREILSIEVAVEEGNEVRIDDLAERDLSAILGEGEFPDTSSISLRKAYSLVKEASGRAAVIRYDREENQFQIRKPDTIQLGDILILPSSIAYLHRQKGLCFDNRRNNDAILTSDWAKIQKSGKTFSPGLSHRQSLSKHTQMVMDGTYSRLTDSGNPYRQTLIRILQKLENKQQVEDLADLVANLARVAAAFHDFGKADMRWQKKIRQLDPDCPQGLIGRSLNTGGRIGIPHTPPGYVATVQACNFLLGYADKQNSLDPLIRAVALAACRHHSSLLNPARVENYKFEPHPETADFVREILLRVGASQETVNRADDIIEAAKTLPSLDTVPLMLPNEDLFPIYALVGRAILMADREDASGLQMEQLR